MCNKRAFLAKWHVAHQSVHVRRRQLCVLAEGALDDVAAAVSHQASSAAWTRREASTLDLCDVRPGRVVDRLRSTRLY
eukprot:486818-Prymnesium_polylepis.2